MQPHHSGARRWTDTPYRTVVGDGVPDLGQRLSVELDKVNAAATAGVAPCREPTVQVLDDSGELAVRMSGWGWGVAAGTAMTWMHEDALGDGLASRLMTRLEVEATGAMEHARVRHVVQLPGAVHLRMEL